MSIDIEAAFLLHLERQKAPTTTITLDPPEPAARSAAARVKRATSLLATVADATGVPVADIKGPLRAARISRARHIFCWIARNRFAWSFPRIAAFVGGKDHSSAMYGVAKVDARKQHFEPELSICDGHVAREVRQ